MVFNRYQMCSPDYREAKNRWADMQWNTCRQNLGNWADKGAVYLNKLVPALKAKALEEGANVNVDETWCRYQTHPALQIANTWRSHVLSFVMQEHGIPVLPAPTWSYTTSYDYCFDGHEKGGVVLVSTIGTLRNDKSQMYFKEGFFEMLKRLDPEEVILYGDVPEKILKWIPKQLPIKVVGHYRFERARRYGK
jgi:hypothetical protein